MLYLNVNLVLIIPLSIIRTVAVTLCMGAVSINSRCNYASDSTMVFVDEAGLLCSHNLSSGITSHNLTASTFVSDKYSSAVLSNSSHLLGINVSSSNPEQLSLCLCFTEMMMMMDNWEEKMEMFLMKPSASCVIRILRSSEAFPGLV